jgi:hypothetical protein
MKIDLQMHSSCSDGELSPAELMAECKKAGLDVVALTDHDTIAGIKEAQAEAERLGMHFIPGVEFGCEYEGESIHLLGLGIDSNNLVLIKKLEDLRVNRKERAEQIIKNLEAIGFEVDRSILQGDQSLIRPNIARAVKNPGIGRSEFIEKWISEGKPCYVARHRPSVKEIIDLIHQAGGKAIWAHPIYTLRNKLGKYSGFTKAFSRYGLDGIEVFYPQHYHPLSLKAYTEIFRYGIDIDRRVNGQSELILTAGSDFHGQNRPENKLGEYATYGLPFDPAAIVKKILEV